MAKNFLTVKDSCQRNMIIFTKNLDSIYKDGSVIYFSFGKHKINTGQYDSFAESEEVFEKILKDLEA